MLGIVQENNQVIPPINNRMTVVENIYYQPINDSPITILGRANIFSTNIESNESPYERHRVATPKWEVLDSGWIDTVGGVLVLRNEEGKFTHYPSLEEKEKLAAKVLEISFDGVNASISVLPSETCRLRLINLKQVYLHSRSEPVKYTLALLPE